MEKKKHQRQSISLETKIAILDRLGKGGGSTAIGKHLNLGESTGRERECATADEGAAKIFPEKLAKIIEDGDYSADQVFNADETGLYWKRLLNRTYIAKDEKTASGHKESKDRVTLLLCSNTSGDRMLKPLLINKSLRPRTLKGKDLKQLPVHWMANPKTWMTTAFFTEWFNNCFVPEVEAYMKEKSLDFKVLLIVDNAASHPNVQLATYKFILNKLEKESLIVKDVWKQFSIFDCLIHVASASAQIRPRTLNAFWKKIWPACVTDNTTTQTSTLSDEIINLAHEIGGDGFNTFSHDNIDELLVDDALSDNDIDLTLDPTVDGGCGSPVVKVSNHDRHVMSSIPVPLKTRRVGQRCTLNLSRAETSSRWCGVVVRRGGASSDGVVGLGDNDEEEKSTPLTGKLIQEGLQLCSKLENHFLINDPNSERASKLQRELQNCMSGYRELYKKIKESSSQSLITDFIVRKGRATQNENEVCENPWPLPQISIAERVSSDDEEQWAVTRPLIKARWAACGRQAEYRYSKMSLSPIIGAVHSLSSSTAMNSSNNTIGQSNLAGVFRILFIPRKEIFSP
ncbi:tigger transposable element-derived protein 1 [Trichonephila clavipes]|uniref:Tigger transposable element-derived protein 1 n=1 Tax=Trichonephila clavipes TaxID=2585209 RepID=A0A8X6VB40_TRICX|nr:tigger transposable element-derived protein 1 [Trichonephila clavipes]